MITTIHICHWLAPETAIIQGALQSVWRQRSTPTRLDFWYPCACEPNAAWTHQWSEMLLTVDSGLFVLLWTLDLLQVCSLGPITLVKLDHWTKVDAAKSRDIVPAILVQAVCQVHQLLTSTSESRTPWLSKIRRYVASNDCYWVRHVVACGKA